MRLIQDGLMGPTDNQKQISKIIHVGVDCFYAAIMTRDNPLFQCTPVVVCNNATRMEVICSANYEAREFGIHAGMKLYRAKQLYPKLVILLSEINTFKKESKEIHAIFHRFTNMMEPLSLDEAYLNITGSDRFVDLVASEIRKLIYEKIGLTASAGIASNKLLAKVASDWKKPNGQFSITPDIVNDFVLKLPVKKIWDISEKTVNKIARLGLTTCGDLQKLPLQDLDSYFGSIGKHLYDICRGIDNRPVNPSKGPKPLSIEEMLRTDIQVIDESKKDEKTAGENKKAEKPIDENKKGEKPGDEKESSLEAPTKIETGEETQGMAKKHPSILEQFKNAAAIFIEFKGKKYRSTLAKSAPGKQMVFTVSKLDIYLSMNVSEGDQIVLRLVTTKGTIVAFESELIKKKLPQLIVKFPIKEDESFIRTNSRAPARINARIVRSKSKISAMGTIINVSDTGCSFTTNAMLKSDDEIELLLLLLIKGVEKDYMIRGTIRRERTVDDETTNYGIECLDEDKKALMEIKAFIESQKADKSNKTVK